MPEERQFSGAVLRADVAWLEKNGLKEAVRERVPAETRALLDKPPLPISWVSGRHVDAVLEAVMAAAGEDKVIQLGAETTRNSFGPVVRPLLKTLVTLFGASPAALFSRLDTVLPVFSRGSTFTYEPSGEREGLLRLRIVDRAPRAWFVQWRGTLAFGFEVAGVNGSIASCDIDARANGAVYRVAWSA
ncbi:MAG TPA: hypothetical protein VI356_22485 [Myxococcales bacterium]